MRIHILVINFKYITMKVIMVLIGLLISGDIHTTLIPNITSPEQIIWADLSHVIFVKDENIFEYDIFNKERVNIGKRNHNEFVGIGEDGNLILCEIEHSIITSTEEFSTVFRIDGKELKFFPTIQPIYLHADMILAKTALDFLEQHYYEIHISDGSMREVPKPAYIDSGLGIYGDEMGNVYMRLDLRRFLRNIYYELIYSKDMEGV